MTKQRAFFSRPILLALFLVMGISRQGAALDEVSSNGVHICYPRAEASIALKLRDRTPGILSFLKARGLEVKTPLYVILDDGLDKPDVVTDMIPHREIRIPLRAPGVLEDGYLAPDPWIYFYFKGLCLQGIYSIRHGLPAHAHSVFGEGVSPNIILPTWFTDGVFSILYSSWSGSPLTDPYNRALAGTTLPRDFSLVSNHPGSWPGYYTGRIYGIPFMAWVSSRYGWERVREFLSIHGGGVIPIEIELKARKAFGKSWSELWDEFAREAPQPREGPAGALVEGYWPEPFVYWNTTGTYPGRKGVALRGRYGCPGPGGTLWLSEYTNQGASRMAGYGNGMVVDGGREHLWDPAPGYVGVTRTGSRPALAFFDITGTGPLARVKVTRTVPAPPGVIQLSGPAMDASGRVAVAGHSREGWDIWVYDQVWQRATQGPGIELDPWWDGTRLLFVSDATGSFQVHDSGLSPVTRAPLGAMLPRNGAYLSLTPTGWTVERLPVLPVDAPRTAFAPIPAAQAEGENPADQPGPEASPYSPLKSLPPDFFSPDLYLGPSDVQAGLITWGTDVSRDYSVGAGARYSFNLEYVCLQGNAQIRGLGLSYARYPLSYDPKNQPATEESRSEASLSFRHPDAPWATLSLTRQHYEPLEDQGIRGRDLWGEAAFRARFGPVSPSLSVETHSGGMRSVSGGLSLVLGKDLVLQSQVLAGKTWGETEPGHGTFRVGGDVGEGYFTRRSSRLFPLRGFSPNILEADQAVTVSTELTCPLAELQMGRSTLPLFLHRLSLGAFADAGVCSDRITRQELMAGVGFELITSLEVAWGSFSVFKMGVAWPALQPEGFDEKGPVVVFQVGRPL